MEVVATATVAAVREMVAAARASVVVAMGTEEAVREVVMGEVAMGPAKPR